MDPIRRLEDEVDPLPPDRPPVIERGRLTLVGHQAQELAACETGEDARCQGTLENLLARGCSRQVAHETRVEEIDPGPLITLWPRFSG